MRTNKHKYEATQPPKYLHRPEVSTANLIYAGKLFSDTEKKIQLIGTVWKSPAAVSQSVDVQAAGKIAPLSPDKISAEEGFAVLGMWGKNTIEFEFVWNRLVQNLIATVKIKCIEHYVWKVSVVFIHMVFPKRTWIWIFWSAVELMFCNRETYNPIIWK